MSAVDPTIASSGLARALRTSAVLVWRELPRVLGVSAVLGLAAAPGILAGATGAPALLTALACAPLALATTAWFRVLGSVAAGGRARWSDLARIDPVLAIVGLGAVTAALLLSARSDALALLGYALAAIASVVLPLALAYATARELSGLAALRGGLILAAYRPGAALTLLGLAVLAAFAVAATVGVAALVVPAIVAVTAVRVVRGQLDEIDGQTASAP